jgi:hypothetical protein
VIIANFNDSIVSVTLRAAERDIEVPCLQWYKADILIDGAVKGNANLIVVDRGAAQSSSYYECDE